MQPNGAEFASKFRRTNLSIHFFSCLFQVESQGSWLCHIWDTLFRNLFQLLLWDPKAKDICYLSEFWVSSHAEMAIKKPPKKAQEVVHVYGVFVLTSTLMHKFARLNGSKSSWQRWPLRRQRLLQRINCVSAVWLILEAMPIMLHLLPRQIKTSYVKVNEQNKFVIICTS